MYVLLELTIEHLVRMAEKINSRDARRLALELGFYGAEYEQMWSFGYDKRVILYILITWFDRNEHTRDMHTTLDQALIATGYRTLAIASIGIFMELQKYIINLKCFRSSCRAKKSNRRF